MACASRNVQLDVIILSTEKYNFSSLISVLVNIFYAEKDTSRVELRLLKLPSILFVFYLFYQRMLFSASSVCH
jgi:hypothetical protein